MSSNSNAALIRLLSHTDSGLRMTALHALCEGYVEDAAVVDAIRDGWQRWGIEAAFPEFPMLSFVPVRASDVEDYCELAEAWAADRRLTDKTTRCAGKLIEQVVQLPPAALAQHVARLESTVSVSKIFFRVDVAAVRQRVELMEASADQLAGHLDHAIERLGREASDDDAFNLGLHALEALRRDHADYLQLSGVLAKRPDYRGPGAASFRLTLHSLIRMAQPHSEDWFALHLHDERSSVHCGAVEALVRCRSPRAGQILAEHLLDATTDNQRWLARGLQRLRVEGLAQEIGELRRQTTDPALGLMLLIAEVRQLDIDNLDSLIAGLEQIQVHSDALQESLRVFCKVHQGNPRLAVLREADRANHVFLEN